MTMCKPSSGFNNDNAGNDENDPVLTSNQNNNTGTANNAEDSEREVWEFMTPKVKIMFYFEKKKKTLSKQRPAFLSPVYTHTHTHPNVFHTPHGILILF